MQPILSILSKYSSEAGDQMKCPKCGADRPMVPSTRRRKKDVLRVRQCRKCGMTWETIEVILTDKVRDQVKAGEQLSLLDAV